MRRYLAFALILVGLALWVLALLVLPGDEGRFEYLIEITDSRPASESEMTGVLQRLGGVRALVMANPMRGVPEQILLLPELRRELHNDDCALGALPQAGGWQGLAGSSSGLERGAISLAGHPVSICATLQPLGPLFDASLIMDLSPQVQDALSAGGWKARASYLLFPSSWEERNRLLATLRSRPEALPSPDAQVLSPGERPLLGSTPRTLLSAALICAGLLIIALQLRGLSRRELARSLGRSQS